MKLQTTNLITETLEFLNSKPWHYGDEDIFQLTEAVEHGTLKKSGNSYSFALRGKQVELKPQPTKRMWDRYSKKAEAGVSEEQAKKISKRRQALKSAREVYRISKTNEQMIAACGVLEFKDQDLYVMIFDSQTHGANMLILHMNFSGERAKSQVYQTRLEELSNYATKRPVVLNKLLDKRGTGSKANVGRKAKEAA